MFDRAERNRIEMASFRAAVRCRSDVHVVALQTRRFVLRQNGGNRAAAELAIVTAELAQNALDHGGGYASLEARLDRRRIEIHVHDRGAGARTVARSGLGLGLGLGAVQRLVDEMHTFRNQLGGRSVVVTKHLGPREAPA